MHVIASFPFAGPAAPLLWIRPPFNMKFRLPGKGVRRNKWMSQLPFFVQILRFGLKNCTSTAKTGNLMNPFTKKNHFIHEI
jgi:hypothetical protein